MSRRWCWMLLGLSAVGSGCELCKDAARNVTYEVSLAVENFVERRQHRQQADQAWEQMICQAGYRGPYSADFERGFKDGYADYLYAGGDGHPPAVPPHRYWKASYATPAGNQAMQDWFAGFRQGTALAQQSGARQYVTLPSSFSPAAAPAMPLEGPHGPVESAPLAPLPLPRETPGEPGDGSPGDLLLPPPSAADQPEGQHPGVKEVIISPNPGVKEVILPSVTDPQRDAKAVKEVILPQPVDRQTPTPNDPQTPPPSVSWPKRPARTAAVPMPPSAAPTMVAVPPAVPPANEIGAIGEAGPDDPPIRTPTAVSPRLSLPKGRITNVVVLPNPKESALQAPPSVSFPRGRITNVVVLPNPRPEGTASGDSEEATPAGGEAPVLSPASAAESDETTPEER